MMNLLPWIELSGQSFPSGNCPIADADLPSVHSGRSQVGHGAYYEAFAVLSMFLF
jgi:hypothetical protein